MAESIKGKNAEIVGKFTCPGFNTFGPFKLIGGTAKGRPDENDLKDAVEFYRSARYIIAASDVAEYPIVISRIADEDDSFDDGGYYGLYDGVKVEQANDILDLLRDNEKTKVRTKLRKTLEQLVLYVDGVGSIVLDDLIPDEWYDAWKDMEGIVTAEKHIDGYWDKNIMEIGL